MKHLIRIVTITGLLIAGFASAQSSAAQKPAPNPAAGDLKGDEALFWPLSEGQAVRKITLPAAREQRGPDKSQSREN